MSLLKIPRVLLRALVRKRQEYVPTLNELVTKPHRTCARTHWYTSKQNERSNWKPDVCIRPSISTSTSPFSSLTLSSHSNSNSKTSFRSWLFAILGIVAGTAHEDEIEDHNEIQSAHENNLTSIWNSIHSTSSHKQISPSISLDSSFSMSSSISFPGSLSCSTVSPLTQSSASLSHSFIDTMAQLLVDEETLQIEQQQQKQILLKQQKKLKKQVRTSIVTIESKLGTYKKSTKQSRHNEFANKINDESLSLTKFDMPSLNYWSSLSFFLSIVPILHLNLSNIEIPSNLLSQLQHSNSLQTLILSNNSLGMDRSSMSILVKWLSKCTDLSSLEVSRNSLVDSHLYELLPFCRSHPSLQSLSLCWNGITDQGVLFISTYLRTFPCTSVLATIDVSYNRIRHHSNCLTSIYVTGRMFEMEGKTMKIETHASFCE